MAGNRVGQADQLRVAGEIRFPGFFDEGEVDHFLIAAVSQYLPDARQRPRLLGLRQHRQDRLRRCRGNVLVALQASDFLDQVFLDLDVEAVARRRDDEVLAIAGKRQGQAREQFADTLGGQRQPEHLGDARRAQAHRLPRRQARRRLADRPRLAAADIDHQPRGTLERAPRAGEVDAALETMRRVRNEAIAPRTPGNRRRREKGRFEEHLGGGRGDAAGFVAHDPGHRHRTLCIADQQDVGLQGQRLLVEQADRLARLRHAGVDGAVQAAVVESMQRLSEFEHHVVGDVDQRRDRTQAAALQAPPHPRRGGGGAIDAGDHPTAVARAGRGRVEHDGALGR